MSGLDYRICRKRHRLDAYRYVGSLTVAFTIGVLDRKTLFNDRRAVEKCLEILVAKLKSQNCEAPIYCFMPDHLHLLVRGLSEESCPKVVVDRFKISAGIWLRSSMPGFRLQHDYYDHIIRSDEDWRLQARYIAQNPVRSGLTDDPMQYARTGCIGMDRDEMLREIFFGY